MHVQRTLEEQDLEHLKVAAEGKQDSDGIRRSIWAASVGRTGGDLVNAAIGKLQVELKEKQTQDAGRKEEIVSYLSMRCFWKSTTRGVRRKDGLLKECLQNIRKEAGKRVKKTRGTNGGNAGSGSIAMAEGGGEYYLEAEKWEEGRVIKLPE